MVFLILHMLELSHNQKKKKMFSRKGIKPFLTLTQQYTPKEISKGGGESWFCKVA